MAAINHKNGRVDKAANNARPTLQSLIQKDSPDSYALLGNANEDLPTSPDGQVDDIFRKNSKVEKVADKGTPAADRDKERPQTSDTPSAGNQSKIPDKNKPEDKKPLLPEEPVKVNTNGPKTSGKTPAGPGVPESTTAPGTPIKSTAAPQKPDRKIKPKVTASPAIKDAETPKKVAVPLAKDPLATPVADVKKTTGEPIKKPALPPDRRQTMAAPISPRSANPATTPTDATRRQTVAVDPSKKPVLSHTDKPKSATPAVSLKPTTTTASITKLKPVLTTAQPVSTAPPTVVASPSPITPATPTTSTTTPPIQPSMVAAVLAAQTVKKSDEDMPKKASPPPQTVPTIITSTKDKPKTGILKRAQTDEPSNEDVLTVPAPEDFNSNKRKSVTLNTDSSQPESLPIDPERSEKIHKRRATQFIPKGKRPTFQLPAEDVEAEAQPVAEKAKPRRVAFNVTDDEEESVAIYLKLKKRRPTTYVPKHVVMDVDEFDEEIGSAGDLIEEMDTDEPTDRTRLLEDDQPQRKEEPKEKEERPKWDVFESNPIPEDDSTMDFVYETARKAFKLITIVFCFLVVCGGSAIHKATVLFAAAQVEDKNNYTCIEYNTTYKCFREGTPKEWGSSTPSCLKSDDFRKGGISREQLCVDIKVRWIWCLVLILGTPELLSFIRSLWNISFKKRRRPTMDALFAVLITETLSVFGTCCFAFVVLPALESSLHGLALMSAVGFIPSVLNAFNRPEDESCRGLQRILDMLVCLIQLSGLIFWPIMIGFNLMTGFNKSLMWSIPLSLSLISLTWWANYVDGASRLGLWRKPLVDLKKRIRKTRTKIYFFVSIWKMLMIVCFMFLFVCVYQGISFKDLFELSKESCDGKLTAADIKGQQKDWVFLWLVNLGAAMGSYFCARAATKVWIQFQSYAMPLVLVTPIVGAVLLFGCHSWVFDNCALQGIVPEYLAFDCKNYTKLLDVVTKDYVWMMYVWWLAQIWITKHIWYPENDKLAKTAILFFNPLFGGLVHEQWLMYNRCYKDKKEASGKTIHEINATAMNPERKRDGKGTDEFGYIEEGMGDKARSRIKKEQIQDQIPMIYICATMWHESKVEMNNMLKSIFRLDMDQCARRKTQEFLGISDRDFYNFEAHIFFDDCMDRGHPKTMFNYTVNQFVSQLVHTVDDAASIIYQMNVSVPPPEKYPTPYGGRLVWTMPGGNQIVCHLKDKEKIRIKKRWSQVMYMYYFLGFKLFTQENLPTNRKQLKADNTFLLALDGDVDFEPLALRLLVDKMKRDIKVGAACGRIHPTGSGPMVWYQKFEYALGHWMQKATEHVLGCVLCSPGCFSLFRGSAIMDDNVMQKYTTTSEEARHLVQYDQGEDRWLCTLLLQRGHRVEYNAASDSFTFAPEEFNEFYNQRRRWTPSTMANVMDLLGSWRNTVKVNENISMLYIFYQGSIFVSSLLGTGTIFLMIVGSLSVAYKISAEVSFLINIVPITIFLILCYTTKSEIQLIAANILTWGYGLVQIVVLIAIIIQMAEEGVCSPTFIFFMYVAGTFILAAILHPQEFFCVVHGLLYFVLIPSMYMLLMMYSLTNLNNVSWGTREVKQTKSQKEQEEFEREEAERKAREEEAKKNGTWERMKAFVKSKTDKLSESTETKDEGWTLGIGNCFRFICCPRPVQEDKTHLNRIFDKIDDQKKAMDEQTELIKTQKKAMKKLANQIQIQQEVMLEDSSDEEDEPTGARSTRGMSLKRKMSRKLSTMPKGGLSLVTDDTEEEEEENEEQKKQIAEIKRQREEKAELARLKQEEEEKKRMLEKELTDPEWIKDTQSLRKGPIRLLNEEENLFFLGLIKRYLKPLVKNKEKEEQVNRELADLKNKISFGYVLMNATFVAVIFTLQQNKGRLSIPWVCGNLSLEPIGLMFLLFFGVIMFLQTVGMVTHRLGTFLHIVANTQLMTTTTDNQSVVSNMISMTKAARHTVDNSDTLSTLSETESEYGGGEEVRPSRRKSTIYRLEQHHAKGDPKERRPTIALDHTISSFLNQLVDEVHDDNTTAEKMSNNYKRNSIFGRRKSVATFEYLKQRRQSLHKINENIYDNPDDGRSSMDGYTNTEPPLGGYSRIKPRINGLPNGNPYVNMLGFGDSAEVVSEEPSRGGNQREHRLDPRKVSQYSMSPSPDYDEVGDPDGYIPPRQKSSNDSFQLPTEDYGDDNDSFTLHPAITIGQQPKVPEVMDMYVIRPVKHHNSQNDDITVDYDIDDPTRSSRLASQSSRL